MEQKKFAVIGVAGFIAARHVKAIKETDNDMVAALDKFDSVGYIDQYFPDADFFTEFERFDRHIDKLKRQGTKVDYVSICSPNYLHDSHIRFALRSKAFAICEKPVVLNPWNIDALQEVERNTGYRVYNILQLRLHQSILDLKKKIADGPAGKIYDIDLVYITSRGSWYYFSWKGDTTKSGGIATNIGVHFFDMLIWIFGKVRKSNVHFSSASTVAGYLELERARIRWFLSIDYNVLPEEVKKTGQRTYRSITVEGSEIEFSEGFTNLHTLSYKAILDGNAFGLEDARESIETVYAIRNSESSGIQGDYHPLCLKL
ncbi:MAG: Gfo/Idh/MocA family oxidoreductase [Bacteroidetes bacterium]|nr:Gfo/Idh/MocA family oxidoreductase [Bacteroidota bacterium]